MVVWQRGEELQVDNENKIPTCWSSKIFSSPFAKQPSLHRFMPGCIKRCSMISSDNHNYKDTSTNEHECKLSTCNIPGMKLQAALSKGKFVFESL